MNTNHLPFLTQLHSPLLRLPPELRNLIYSLVFENRTINVVPRKSQTQLISRSPHNYTGPIALFLVCRQVNNEAYSLFLATSIFDITQMKSRSDMLATLSPSRCSAIESCLFDHELIGLMTWGHWWVDEFDTGVGDQECFGALRRVYVAGGFFPSRREASMDAFACVMGLSRMLKREEWSGLWIYEFN